MRWGALRFAFWVLAVAFWALEVAFREVAFWVLAVVFWVLAVAFWVLAVAFWALEVTFWVLVVAFWALAAAFRAIAFWAIAFWAEETGSESELLRGLRLDNSESELSDGWVSSTSLSAAIFFWGSSGLSSLGFGLGTPDILFLLAWGPAFLVGVG